MSNHLAIATVTKALGQILDGAVKTVVDGATVEMQRPGQNVSGAKLHLFLYQVTPNGALRNDDLPTRDAEGRVRNRPTTALDLHYLLSFYGEEKKFEPQRMLGGVVRGLLAEPGLTRERIVNVSKDDGDKLNESNLAYAVEQVKFTPLPLTLEELSRIWSIFYQTPYALSVAYLATVVVIDSDEPVQASLPVLRRGQNDQGVDTELGPFPILESIHIGEGADDTARLRQPSYPSVRLGTILTLRGRDLGGDRLVARFTHQHLQEQVTDLSVTLTPGRRGEIIIPIPKPAADQSKWAAGIYRVTLIANSGGRDRSTNSLPLPFAPEIRGIAVDAPDLDQNVLVTLTVVADVRPSQTAILVLPDREVAAQPRAQRTDALKFLVTTPPSGPALVRLRVDGVENLEFKREGVPPRLVIDQQGAQFP